MRRWTAVAAAALLALGAAAGARAATEVEVVDTWPAADAQDLAPNEVFYLRLRYRTDAPVHIWARPRFQGKPIAAGSNPSRVYPPGTGEALVWFFLWDAGTQVDEVRITAGDGGRRNTPVVLTYPVALAAGSGPSPRTDAMRPAWLTQLRASDAAIQRADEQQRMREPTTAGDVALLNGFLIALLGGGLFSLAAPLWGVWRWRGAWRWIAAVGPPYRR